MSVKSGGITAAAKATAASHPRLSSSSSFRNCPIAAQAISLLDGVPLVPTRLNGDNGIEDDVNGNDTDTDKDVVIMPWIAFGTYKLGAATARRTVRHALSVGYRHVDTAFIYGNEKTEIEVGLAIQDVIRQQQFKNNGNGSNNINNSSCSTIKSRQDIFITTKHWRKYHGYEPTLTCLDMSLKRLQVDYIDLWLMHWPGPAFNTMARKKDEDPWNYAVVHDKTVMAAGQPLEQSTNNSTSSSTSMTPSEQMVQLRAETWRAMEHAYRQGKVRAIGVSNFSIQHLQTLEKTGATIRPMVNQVELHPLHPQNDLIQYCHKHGIIVQAYASLGGQDAGKKFWKQLLGENNHLPSNNDSSSNGRNAAAAGAGAAAKRKRSNTTAKGNSSSSSGTGNNKCDLLHAPAVVSLAEKCRHHQQQEPQQQQQQQQHESISISSSKNKYATRNKTTSTSSCIANTSSSSNSSSSAVTPAQVLLRWALERNVPIIPKTTSIERMHENTKVLDFHLTHDQVQSLSIDLLNIVRANHHASAKEKKQDEDDNSNNDDDDDDDNDNECDIQKLTRLCWIRDPFRHLEFD